MLAQEEIIGSVGAGDAFCAGLLYGCHERWPLAQSIQLAHACARASLLCANAIDGAKSLEELKQEIDSAP
jgi:sugar/nucleoside kinase (ribokinase family)